VLDAGAAVSGGEAVCGGLTEAAVAGAGAAGVAALGFTAGRALPPLHAVNSTADSSSARRARLRPPLREQRLTEHDSSRWPVHILPCSGFHGPINVPVRFCREASFVNR
jgi:hypothetical protein